MTHVTLRSEFETLIDPYAPVAQVGTGFAAVGAAAGWVFLVAGLRERGIDAGWVSAGGTQVVAGLVAAAAVAALARQWRAIDTRGLA